MLSQFIDLFLHLDTHLQQIIEQFGPLTYVLLFLIVFCETGLVVTPFLPGDSLLFAAGTFAATGSLHPLVLAVIFTAAAIVGDAANYAIGAFIGPRVFLEKRRFLNRDHLLQAERFYERHGGKAIVLARFLPIVRTMAPFVAGVGRMHYGRFFAYNVFGGVLWVTLFLGGGYLFGNIPAVQENFEIVILAIIGVSLLPGIIHYAQHWWRRRCVYAARPLGQVSVLEEEPKPPQQ